VLYRDEFEVGGYLLGVSSTSDPRDKWHLFTVPASDVPDTWADYPGLGYDDSAVYITGNLFGSGSGPTITVLDKSELYSGQLNSVHFFTDEYAELMTQRPAIPLGPNDAAYIADLGYGGIEIWPISLTSELGEPTVVPLDLGDQMNDSPPLCNPLEAGAWKLQDTYVLDKVLYTSITEDNFDGHTSMRVVKIDLRTMTVLNEARLNLPNGDLLYGSLIPTRDHTYLICSMLDRNSGEEWNGPVVAVDPFESGVELVSLQKKQVCYDISEQSGRNRWGDYFTTALDPDGERAWGIGEYPTGSAVWATWVASFSGPETPMNAERGLAIGRGSGIDLSYEATTGDTVSIEHRGAKDIKYLPLGVMEASKAVDIKLPVIATGDSLVFFHFKTRRAGKNSDWTLDDTAYILKRPEKLIATRVDNSIVKLTWTNASSLSKGARVERRMGNGEWQVIRNSPSKKISAFTDSTAIASDAWSYRVIALVPSRVDSLSHESLASEEVVMPAGEKSVDWNPARTELSVENGHVILTLETAAEVRYSIFGIGGGVVFESSIRDVSGKDEFSLPKLPSGTYIARALVRLHDGEDRVISRRIQVAR
jgi:hypothetical protein